MYAVERLGRLGTLEAADERLRDRLAEDMPGEDKQGSSQRQQSVGTFRLLLLLLLRRGLRMLLLLLLLWWWALRWRR